MTKITQNVAQELSVRIQSFVLSLNEKQKNQFIGLLAQIMLAVISTEEVPDEPVNTDTNDDPSTMRQEISHEERLTTPAEESTNTTVETTAETNTTPQHDDPTASAETVITKVVALTDTAPCANRRRADTGEKYTTPVPIANRTWGLCPECLHPCSSCGKIIPIFYTHCKPCKALLVLSPPPAPCPTVPPLPEDPGNTLIATKACNGCWAAIPADGPNYCNRCGHKCATCEAVIPMRFSHCMAEACQDEKWLREHPPTSSQGLSPGALAHRAHKKARAAEQSQSVMDARKARGIKK